MSSLETLTENASAKAIEAGSFASRTVDNAANSAHNAINRASTAAGPAVDSMATGAHNAIDKITGVATQAAEKLNVSGDQIRDVQSRFSETCKTQMKENPVVTLGVAVAAGFLLSKLLSLR